MYVCIGPQPHNIIWTEWLHTGTLTKIRSSVLTEMHDILRDTTHDTQVEIEDAALENSTDFGLAVRSMSDE